MSSQVKDCFKENGTHFFQTNLYIPGGYSKYMDDTGSIKFAICLTVFFPSHQMRLESNSMILEEFNKVSSTKTCKNWATLLENMNDPDLKIITNDNQEILAHKLVLKGKKNVH